MRKSIKDYAIYFLTLVLGVAIFYMFNSLDSQQAMLEVSSSQQSMIELLITMLEYISVFVAAVLGLLIVYANNFLINRRKKEFGIYMTLGMSKNQISRIIVTETVFIGIVSLGIGLVIGIFASQFMSVLVAKMFEVNMSRFTFVFSGSACIKTCIYFAVMYLAVMIFNAFTVSKYKLISLLSASKKNETLKIKNPFVCVLVFIAASALLGYAYWMVTADINSLHSAKALLKPILMGTAGTVLVFWSLSGFILQIVQKMKKIYFKDTNLFVLRQIHNKINTMVASMSVICLMLFMTISILSSAMALKSSMQKDLEATTPVDINLSKPANLPEHYTSISGKVLTYSEEERADSRLPISETLKNSGLDMSVLKDVVEIPVYAINDLTFETFLGDKFEEIDAEYPHLIYSGAERIVKISDYNKVAALYGTQTYDVRDNEYIVLCDFDNMTNIRNRVLSDGNEIEIAGKKYVSKYKTCVEGFLDMSTSHTNIGILIVPDSCNLTEEVKEQHFLAANYNADSNEQKAKIEELFANRDSGLIQSLRNTGLALDGATKITLFESSLGLASIITFIAIYLGVIFLIASSVILALKQLTEASDNKQRYTILRKIGCDETMIHRALFRQIGIFFALPLLLAVIHSVFGIQFIMEFMSVLASKSELLPSVIATAVIIGGIYGAYFLATYLSSKGIIKEE